MLVVASLTNAQTEPPPLEAYGRLPEASLVSLSPSGQRVALRQSGADFDIIAVYDIVSGERLQRFSVGEIGARNLLFANDDTVIAVVRKTTRAIGYRGSWDYSAAFALDIREGNHWQLLRRLETLYPAQSGLGRVVGRSRNGEGVMMPAFVFEREDSEPTYGLVDVPLTGSARGLVREQGSHHTVDWFVSSDGEPLLREDIDNEHDLYRIWYYRDGKRTLVYEEETGIPETDLVGFMPNREAAVIGSESAESGRREYFRLDFETGEVSGPILGHEDKDIERVLRSIDRIVIGVEYAGFKPTYEFFDASLTARIAAIQDGLPDTSVRLVSWSEDFSKLVVYISGGWHSGAFLLIDGESPDPIVLAESRTDIPTEHVAPTQAIEFTASDGLAIPALVTATAEVRAKGKARLVVLPHGGPAAHDRFEFDWLAQFLASRGYVVLQPQFRGSTGFGLDLMRAGFGEWGRKMQTDLNDGVSYLVETGLVDPERVCIVGASYGGYAALAAVSFFDDIYRCAASINGVTDLRSMHDWERRYRGGNHWVLDYWERFYGTERGERRELDALSPAKHAEDIDVPVLLVHGARDTIVPVQQSRSMRRALRQAGRDVQYVELKGEDHWLSFATTRLHTLEALEGFLEEHL